MRGYMRGDGVRSPQSPPSRSPSVASLGSTNAARFSLSQAPHADLPPSYVAAAAASEIVSSLHSRPGRNSDPNFDRPAVLSEEALTLINTFLDFLLYNTLAAARSSALDPIRRAVEHIVKGKLGQQAVQCGEYELEELINEEDENELASMQHTPDAEAHWDADMVWKRTRLKIFTYMRLSEIEDDDEDDFVEQEMATDEREGHNRFSRRAGLVSWPAMIFLTGAWERVAEQCVKDAGESAHNRASLSRPSTRNGSYDDDDDVLVVSEQDVRKLALSQLLGKIWRTWKHTIPRSPPRTAHSPWRYGGHERGSSIMSDSSFSRRPSHTLPPITDDQRVEHAAEPTVDNPPAPKSPRPISDQITDRSKATRHAPRRSRSFGRFPVVVPGRNDSGSRRTQRTEPATESGSEQRLSRMRSNSLPPPALQTANLPVPDRAHAEPASATATGSPSQEKRKSRRSRDLATEAARAAPQAAAATMAAKASKRSSQASQKRRSKEVRRSRDMASSDEDYRQAAAHHSRADRAVRPPVQTAASSGASDDEYDPFRADRPTPPPVRSPTSESADQQSSMPPPVHETLRNLSQRDSMSPPPQRDSGPTATLDEGAVSTAILGSTSSVRKSRKPAPLDMSATSTPYARKPTRDNYSQPERTPSDGRAAKPVSAISREVSAKEYSPAQTSAGRADGSRTPSSSKLQRMGTSDTGSAPYHTPRGSPTAFDERPMVQSRTSDPTNHIVSVKPMSPKTLRCGVESATQNSFNKAPTTREHNKGGSMSARSDKEFYDMMAGNGTVKRSLTPKALTEIEAADSPATRQQQVKSTYGPPSPMPTQYPISEDPEPAISPSEAMSPKMKKIFNIGAIRQAAEARAAESGSSSSPRSPRSGLTAREAREQTYRTNDMADFIRSTAPTSPDQAPRLVSPMSSTPTTPGTKAPATYQQPSVKSVVPNTSRAAQKKQIRPTVMERQANDDLISFLNEGPPGAHVNKSRSMETTNSRGNDNMGLGTMTPANRSSSQMSQSINESVTSHSGLLSKNTGSDRSPMMNASAPRSAPLPKAMDSGAPTRKQRRVKDPYAIDSDDEDEDVLTGLPQKEEQSESMGLVDFLRSTAPPDDNHPSGPRKESPSKRFTSPSRGKRGTPAPFGTQSTAVGGPRPLHKTIPSNEEIKRDPGDLALPHFLKEDRQVRPRESYDSDSQLKSRKARSSSKSSDTGRGGMRGLFKRIGVNG